MYDLAIIGGGIAGVSAAVYARRTNVSVVLCEGLSIGGQLSYIESVENYPGLTPISGFDFIQHLQAQLNHFSIEVITKNVTSVNPYDRTFLVSFAGGGIQARSVVVAVGAQPQKLGVTGEALFTGKGVSYCAVCDGFFYKNKVVGVVGGGNSALEEALYLSRIAQKVLLIHRRDSFRGFPALVDKVEANPAIQIMRDSVVEECVGQEALSAVTVKNVKNGTRQNVPVHGLFIAVGYVPQTAFIPNTVRRDDKGFIVTDDRYRTSCPGIFACGDCRQRPVKQLITAAAEGAGAALNAYDFLKG